MKKRLRSSPYRFFVARILAPKYLLGQSSSFAPENKVLKNKYQAHLLPAPIQVVNRSINCSINKICWKRGYFFSLPNEAFLLPSIGWGEPVERLTHLLMVKR